MDIHLPGISGIELKPQIEMGGGAAPAIVITADDDLAASDGRGCGLGHTIRS
jgi:FixJ family two-component response regulator